MLLLYCFTPPPLCFRAAILLFAAVHIVLHFTYHFAAFAIQPFSVHLCLVMSNK